MWVTEFGELCIHSFIRSPILSFTHSSRGRHTPRASGSSVINSSALARIEQYVLWPCLSDQVPARITWGDFFFNADAQAPLQTQRWSLPMVVPTPVIFFKAPGGFFWRSTQLLFLPQLAGSWVCGVQRASWKNYIQALSVSPKNDTGQGVPLEFPQALTQASPLRGSGVHPEKGHSQLGEAEIVPRSNEAQ